MGVGLFWQPSIICLILTLFQYVHCIWKINSLSLTLQIFSEIRLSAAVSKRRGARMKFKKTFCSVSWRLRHKILY